MRIKLIELSNCIFNSLIILVLLALGIWFYSRSKDEIKEIVNESGKDKVYQIINAIITVIISITMFVLAVVMVII